MQHPHSATDRSRPLLGVRVMVTRPVNEAVPTTCGSGCAADSVPLLRRSRAGGGVSPSTACEQAAAHGSDPADGPDPLAERLQALGAEVIVQPAIRISPPDDWRPVDEALARLQEYDWLVFSSANGVRYLFDRLQDRNAGGTPAPRFPKLAAMGPGTADELERYGRRADLVPEQFRAESLADALASNAVGRRFLLARASRGREVLAERLAAAGAVVEQVVVYTSTDVEHPSAEAAALLHDGKIDWITVTSSAIARSLARLFGGELRRAKLASISPITSDTLRELGYEPTAEAAEYTLAGLTAAIADHR